MASDRHRGVKLQRAIRDRRRKEQPTDRLLQSLTELIDRSRQTVERRRLCLPAISYPEELPVSAQRERILAALTQHQVIIVSGETGSGKTTQLPKICLEAGLGLRGRIGHTQPRRLAAYSVAERIATELGTSASETVGYQVRFDDRCGPETLIKLMTDGILLAEIQHDRSLQQYDALILDEAHERSLNIDFLLGYLKKLLPERPDLKLIVTSATIDVEAFSRHFDGAPVIEVSGRSYPVAVDYLPFDAAESENDGNLSRQLLSACEYIASLERSGRGHGGGDILVFLPGERDIRDCALALRRAGPPDWDVLPLYARLGRAEQVRVFDLSKRRGRRVVLATNVAETSLTVPGIRYVIDSGLARVSRYSHRSRVQRLPIEPVAQANAEQRKGRCGRVGAGLCVRLYSEEDFNNRPAYTDSEIQRTNLASVILQLTLMNFGDISQFPFLEAPDSGLVKDGYRLLEELGALDDKRRLTPVGRALARMPVDPRVGRMLLAAAELGCLNEALIIAAALSIQDPRERPLDKQQAADQAHARFRCASSDFIALVNLWHYFESQRQALSKSQLRKLCQREFLSVRRLFEWRDLHRQLLQVCRQLKLRPNNEAAAESLVHRAVLTGFISHLGQRDEQREYRGARNRRFHLFPGSYLSRKPPPWIVSAELVDTGKLYARTNARIEAQWAIDAAPHLIRRSYAEPHYSQRHRAVMASETVTLYGLTLSQGAKVSYGAIDPVLARELFIREALVAAQYGGKAPFWLHNRALIEDITGLETRLRRHDLLVDDELIYRFYDEHLGSGIWSVAAFDKWRRRVERESPRLLFLDRSRLLSRDPGAVVEQQFPDEMLVDGLSLPLSYAFDPGKERDGVTVTIPLVVLKRLSRARFEWLVPGLLREKCIELVKSLPKPLRKRFVPVPDCVDRALARMQAGNGSLYQALGAALQQSEGVVVPLSAWQSDNLTPFYRMYFSVVDDAGKEIAGGRNLAVLAGQLHQEAECLAANLAPEVTERVYQRWEFGRLEPSRQLAQVGLAVEVFPALIDRGNGVALELRDERAEADALTAEALARLSLLSLPEQAKYLKKQFLTNNRVRLQLTGFFELDALREDYLLGVFAHQFVLPGAVPGSREEFDALLRERRGGLVASGQEYGELVQQIIELHHGIQQHLAGLDARVWAYALKDLQVQLANLLFEHFLRRVTLESLRHYPRYLRAIEHRLQRMAGHQQKDQAATAELQRHQQRLGEYCQQQRTSPAGLLVHRHPELSRYRWLLEEYRVSLFAQGLGTCEPVSGKRLDRLWLELENSVACDG